MPQDNHTPDPHPGNDPLTGVSGLMRDGDHEAAARKCLEHLSAHPDDARARNLLGQIRFHSHGPGDALPFLRQAYTLEPSSPRYAHDYALVLAETGRTDEAADILKRLTATHPEQAEAHFLLGNCYSVAGRHEAAAGRYRIALRLRPDYQEAMFNLAVTLRRMRQPEEAAEIFGRLVSMPGGDNADNNFQAGLTLQALERHREAVPYYRRALELDPGRGDTCYNLGIALRESGQPDQAVTMLEKAAATPGLTVGRDALACNLGLALQEAKRYSEALAAFEEATRENPEHAEAYSNWGSTLLAMGRPEAAIEKYRRAVAIKPGFCEAWYNTGLAFLELLDLEAATEHYRRAISIRPDLAEAHWNLSIVLLLAGKYREGFREYLWRWKRKNAQVFPIDRPEWQGETDPGLTLLIHAEQGLGDAIQFVRYAALVRERVGRIFLACPAALHQLFQSLPWVDAVLLKKNPEAIAPLVDAHVPLLNLPTIFGTTVDTIPAPIPYLAAGRDMVAAAARTVPDRGRLRVGLVWRGNPNHAKDGERSCRLEELTRLLDLDGTEFYSLQKDHDEKLPAHVTDLAPHLGTFADTAAFLHHLDLLVTVDTSVAHLAGALGRPVWVMLPFVPDWRWMTEREDSPWYPTMRLFRQDESRRWEPVIERIREELARMVQAR